MAQICGFKNHNRMTSIISSSRFSDNKFTTEEGVEFMLHELEPNSINYDSGISSRSSMKKRGRPRKDTVRDPENCQENNNVRDMELSEEKLLKKREKRERRERKEREKLRKICLDNSLDSMSKKRGRPRKFTMMEATSVPSSDRLIDYQTSSNTDTLTPPYSELSEESVLGDLSMMEMLNFDQELFPINQEEKSLGLADSFNLNYNWSSIQRIMQLNQALAFTNMYKDFIFWDRIISEFMLPSVTFRLEFDTEKSFDVPFLVVSKLFWIFSQIGLHRINFLPTGITEKLSEKDEGGILFNSSDALIYTSMYNDERLMIQHRTNQLIEFDSKSKISKWTIRFIKCEEFWKSSATDEKANHVEDFMWGFPKRIFEYLDVALVMNSVLPDPSSWLTWFYTYIHQNGLKNFSVVELSRPPSPFKFPIFTDEVLSLKEEGHVGNIEFFDNGRDFIFSVLNSGASEASNFDGAVNELMTQIVPQNDAEFRTETPLEELFEKDAEEFYPELKQNEYPIFEKYEQKDEQVIEADDIKFFTDSAESDTERPKNDTEGLKNDTQRLKNDTECFTDFQYQEQEAFSVIELPIPTAEILDKFDINEQLVVEISDTESKASESSEDDFFDSYN